MQRQRCFGAIRAYAPRQQHRLTFMACEKQPCCASDSCIAVRATAHPHRMHSCQLFPASARAAPRNVPSLACGMLPVPCGVTPSATLHAVCMRNPSQWAPAAHIRCSLRPVRPCQLCAWRTHMLVEASRCGLPHATCACMHCTWMLYLLSQPAVRPCAACCDLWHVLQPIVRCIAAKKHKSRCHTMVSMHHKQLPAISLLLLQAASHENRLCACRTSPSRQPTCGALQAAR